MTKEEKQQMIDLVREATKTWDRRQKTKDLPRLVTVTYHLPGQTKEVNL